MAIMMMLHVASDALQLSVIGVQAYILHYLSSLQQTGCDCADPDGWTRAA